MEVILNALFRLGLNPRPFGFAQGSSVRTEADKDEHPCSRLNGWIEWRC